MSSFAHKPWLFYSLESGERFSCFWGEWEDSWNVPGSVAQIGNGRAECPSQWNRRSSDQLANRSGAEP
jgi:hypothetical protein